MRMRTHLILGTPALLGFGLAACGEPDATSQATPDTAPATSPPTTTIPTEPVYRYSQLLPRDAILPVYVPEFVTADAAPLDDSELVLAIEIDGQAKAYPIIVLNSREMVNDELAGVPILATW